jgi:hypothetical protein
MVPEKTKYIPSFLPPFLIREFDLSELIIYALIVINVLVLAHSKLLISHLLILMGLVSTIAQALHQLSLVINLSMLLYRVEPNSTKRDLNDLLRVRHLRYDLDFIKLPFNLTCLLAPNEDIPPKTIFSLLSPSLIWSLPYLMFPT